MTDQPPDPCRDARDGDETRAVLVAERARAVARVRALTVAFDQIVEYSDGTPPDDEHDPEGATIGWERGQVAAVRDQARDHVAELDAALSRLDAGTYGSCESCGRPIESERLEARPATSRCVGCASGPGPSWKRG